MGAGGLPPTMTSERGNEERRVEYAEQRQRRRAERERFPERQESVSLRPLRSKVTWENGS